MNALQNPRPSPIAGRWYPGEADDLAKAVDGYIQAAPQAEIDGQIIGVIAPHAGYRYSGAVAGHAFAQVQDLEPELVALISPMHEPYPHPLLTSGHDAYQTPLGDIPIDLPAVEALDSYLQENLGTGLQRVYNDNEHSIEIELPFLQRVLNNRFSLLPIMLRDQGHRVVKTLAEGVAITAKARKMLLVGSTDLSHFYPQTEVRRIDHEILQRIESFDPEGALKFGDEEAGYACGRGAVAGVLWTASALGADSVKVLHYATSGDATGDYSSVVGYGAAVIYKN